MPLPDFQPDTHLPFDDRIGSPLVPYVDSYYLPPELQFVAWDSPNVAHVGIDIEHKLTGYDWFNRTLGWSIVSGPAGMTIDSDGTVHWTPDTDLVTEAVTVRLDFDGVDAVTKSFSISVNNSRNYFMSTTGNDSTGDGSLAAPFLTFERIAEEISGISEGVTVHMRGGTYTVDGWDWSALPLSGLENKSWELDDPAIFKSYPEETVRFEISNAEGFRLFGSGWVFQGFEISGGYDCLVVYSVASVKKMLTENADGLASDNVTGIRHHGGSILDACTSRNNYDRDGGGTAHNQSNTLFYGTNGSGIPSFVIDCISDAIGYVSNVGFKIKHAGVDPVHYHNCIDSGSPKSFSIIENRSSIRHSMMYSNSVSDINDSALDVGRTDLTTGGVNETDEGMLVSDSVIVGGSGGRAINNSLYALNATPDTPLNLVRNIIESHSTNDGVFFTKGRYGSDVVPETFTLGFEDNDVFAQSESNAGIIDQATIRTLDYIMAYGTGNSKVSAGVHTKTVNGRTFQISSGVISEVA